MTKPLRPNLDPLNLYYNFLVSALRGDTLNSDSLMKDYNQEILKGLSIFLEYVPNKYKEVKRLYRGYLLEPHVVKTDKDGHYVESLEVVKSLSFSVDKKVAEEFADTTTPISSYVMEINPTSKGYIAELDFYDIKDVLFSYEWVKYLPLSITTQHLNMDLINEQKEVILLNKGDTFRLVEYAGCK